MADGQVKVDLARLAGAIEELQAFDKAIADQLAELEDLVAGLHATWNGEAAVRHAQAHAQWQGGAQRLVDSVNRLRAVSAAAHDNYRSTIEANRARFA